MNFDFLEVHMQEIYVTATGDVKRVKDRPSPPKEAPSTITSPIYRNIAETLNKTTFELYVRESYQPVVHYKYIENPWCKPIHIPDKCELGNMCYARYPLTYIIDMLVIGEEFRWKNSSDIPKAAIFLRSYLAAFEKMDLSGAPEQKAFVDKVALALDKFEQRVKEQKERTEKTPPKKLTLIDRLKALGTFGI